MAKGGFPKKVKQPKQIQIQVPLNQLNNLACSNCGGKLFYQVFAMKKLPALYSPDGKEGTVNVVAGVACTLCSTVGKVMEVKPGSEGNGNGEEGGRNEESNN